MADLFCGAGGTSTGAHKALQARGLNMKLVAVNHWQVAIDTHARNLPAARHYCMNLEDARPDELVPEGYLDLLSASPTCTYHSRARNGKPIHDQMRMDPWTVMRWITTLKVHNLLIENVREFADWGPVCPASGKPIKSRKGEYFNAWRQALHNARMRTEYRVLNCANYGDATTRERLFMVGTSGDGPIAWPDETHAPPAVAAERGLRPWRPALSVIDWTNPGSCIFERPKPLKPKTLRRIVVGVVRHFGALAPYYLRALEIEIRRSCSFYGEAFNDNIPEPRHGRSDDGACVIEFRGTATAHQVGRPLPAFTAGGTHLGLIGVGAEPFILSQASGGAPRATGLPIPTIPGGGAHALVRPEGFGVAIPEALVFHLTHAGSRRVLTERDPFPTITGANRGELALVSRAMVETVAGDLADPRIVSAAERGLLFMEDGDPTRLRILRLNYRMLTEYELASAMSFNDEDGDYVFSGGKTEVIRQIGNAVPVRTAKALVGAIAGASLLEKMAA